MEPLNYARHHSILLLLPTLLLLLSSLVAGNYAKRFSGRNLSPEDLEFLSAHNKARLHAILPPFMWDATLAAYARSYAVNRTADCELEHSTGPYGENLFWGGGNQWTPTQAVRLWVKEHRNYDRRTNTCKPQELCGHYTQIVWRDTMKIGCAQTVCDNGDSLSICEYEPPGNYEGLSPFDRHDPSLYANRQFS